MVRGDDGRKLDHATLEVLRVRSVKQIEAGAHPEEVARALGMDRSTVFGWLAKYRAGGLGALKAKPVPGRPPKLSGEQMRKVYTLVAGADPRQLQLDFALWTRELVRELIAREFGVHLSAVSVGRLLKNLGLSVQRPLWRAYQQDEAAVARWKTEEFPAIRAEAAQVGGVVYFADEAGLRSDYHAGTTWAPVGCTPVVKTTGARHSLNMVSAVTATGQMRFATYTGSFTAETFIDFLARLRDTETRPVFVVVDGHPVHRAKKVTAWVAAQNGRVRLFRLPAYSPELNPDEWVWKNVKADRVGRAGIEDAEDFRAKAISALHRLQKLPHLIRGFFGDRSLAYITA